jgi:hypothetical protein
MKQSNITVLIVLLTFVLVITAAGILISNHYFYTPNFLSVGFGAIASIFSDNVCIEINSDPLIMMTARDRAAIEEYMLSYGGYTIKEQLGASYIFENENSTIDVDSDSKIFWIIWEIGEPKPKKN